MTKLSGKVISKNFGKGSKSEHLAIYVESGKHQYRLKRKGGNPFYDESLNELIGKNVELEGRITEYFFVVEKVNKLENE